MSTVTLGAAELRQRLHKTFPAPAWAVLEEVPNATGGRANRSADAVAVSLWPSRGIYLHGFEIKAHRSDWLRELKNPKKADAIARFCRYWSVVAADGVVRSDELPETWGLLERGPSKDLTWVRRGREMDAEPPTIHFLAALLRRVGEAQEAIRRRAFDAGRARGHEDAPSEERQRVDQLQCELASLRGVVRDFEQKAGVELVAWQLGNIAAAVELTRQVAGWRKAWSPHLELEKAAQAMEHYAEQMRYRANTLAQAEKAFASVGGAS